MASIRYSGLGIDQPAVLPEGQLLYVGRPHDRERLLSKGKVSGPSGGEGWGERYETQPDGKQAHGLSRVRNRPKSLQKVSEEVAAAFLHSVVRAGGLPSTQLLFTGPL